MSRSAAAAARSSWSTRTEWAGGQRRLILPGKATLALGEVPAWTTVVPALLAQRKVLYLGFRFEARGFDRLNSVTLVRAYLSAPIPVSELNLVSGG